MQNISTTASRRKMRLRFRAFPVKRTSRIFWNDHFNTKRQLIGNLLLLIIEYCVYGSLELFEILIDESNSLHHISCHFLISHISSNHPAVCHIWEVHAADLIFSESLSQKFHQLASRLDIRRVVLGGQEESGASNLAGKFGLAASEKSFQSQ